MEVPVVLADTPVSKFKNHEFGAWGEGGWLRANRLDNLSSSSTAHAAFFAR
jgi:hypothetical protein